MFEETNPVNKSFGLSTTDSLENDESLSPIHSFVLGHRRSESVCLRNGSSNDESETTQFSLHSPSTIGSAAQYCNTTYDGKNNFIDLDVVTIESDKFKEKLNLAKQSSPRTIPPATGDTTTPLTKLCFISALSLDVHSDVGSKSTSNYISPASSINQESPITLMEFLKSEPTHVCSAPTTSKHIADKQSHKRKRRPHSFDESNYFKFDFTYHKSDI
ncbi:hypothetical protein CAAN1_01S04896 [[Candida] anglica]|uniref:Uncharacterized protein n=1 Tax=[Candida] anglica TaxID=148631 RepID=A0ABP0EJK3_9ASCO